MNWEFQAQAMKFSLKVLIAASVNRTGNSKYFVSRVVAIEKLPKYQIKLHN